MSYSGKILDDSEDDLNWVRNGLKGDYTSKPGDFLHTEYFVINDLELANLVVRDYILKGEYCEMTFNLTDQDFNELATKYPQIKLYLYHFPLIFIS